MRADAVGLGANAVEGCLERAGRVSQVSHAVAKETRGVGEEDGDIEAEWCRAITVCSRYSFDEPVHTQATQVVGHLPGGQ